VGESKVVFSTTRADLVKARQVKRMFDQVHQPPSRRHHPSSSVPRHMPVRRSPFSGQERPCRQFYEKLRGTVSHGEYAHLGWLSKASHRCHDFTLWNRVSTVDVSQFGITTTHHHYGTKLFSGTPDIIYHLSIMLYAISSPIPRPQRPVRVRNRTSSTSLAAISPRTLSCIHESLRVTSPCLVP